MVTFIIWKQHRLNLLHTDLPSMIRRILKTSLQPIWMELLTIPIHLIFLWDIQRIFSQLWIFRMSFRHYILQEQYSTRFWEKSFLTGRLPQLL